MTELKPHGTERKSVFGNSRNSYLGDVCFAAASISSSGSSNFFLSMFPLPEHHTILTIAKVSQILQNWSILKYK